MARVRPSFLAAAAAAVAVMAAPLPAETAAQTPDPVSLAGGWTLNHELSGPTPSPERPTDGDGRGRRGGFGRPGGMGRGGFRGGMHGGRSNPDPQERQRMREAMHDILAPPDHLTIVETESMLILTGPDGRTTRLAPDGKKVKDDNTGIERQTHWDAGRLVSEITGAGPRKITQAFTLDPDTHRLRITVEMEGGRGGQTRTVTQIYDADAR